jgi:hypothetical protein
MSHKWRSRSVHRRLLLPLFLPPRLPPLHCPHRRRELLLRRMPRRAAVGCCHAKLSHAKLIALRKCPHELVRNGAHNLRPQANKQPFTLLQNLQYFAAQAPCPRYHSRAGRCPLSANSGHMADLQTRRNFRNKLYPLDNSGISIGHQRRKHVTSGLMAGVADEGGPTHVPGSWMRHSRHIDHRVVTLMAEGLRGLFWSH